MNTFQIHEIQGIPVIAPEGAIDITNSSALKDVMLQKLEAGCENLILDLEKVSYIDSSGLSGLVGASTEFEKKQGHLYFCHIGEAVMKVLEMTRLTDYFTIVDDTSKAVDCIVEVSMG